MYLLVLKSRDEFGLDKFVGDTIPRYAILSHTWGKEDDEVTFRDMVDGTGKSKAGYRKIEFCGEQATRDNLKYFWVDTCCIDKSSSTELHEAINSMFRWYRDAARCYVYLADVLTDNDQNSQFSQLPWEPAFRNSKWFTRGWTLQELIAPASVEFFSIEGKRLGDKRSLEPEIREITGVAIPALRGRPLAKFSVSERMSWAVRRQTTRKEDKAYSLLGIFNVYIPLIYGEGEVNAKNRLKRAIAEAKYPEHFGGQQEQSRSCRYMILYRWVHRLICILILSVLLTPRITFRIQTKYLLPWPAARAKTMPPMSTSSRS
jgi:hypothetical protein